MKPDIFHPYIVLKEMCGAGIIEVHGGGNTNDTIYTLNSGSPYQPAYNDAFKLAVTAQLPLWRPRGMSWEMLYNPDLRSSEVKTEAP